MSGVNDLLRFAPRCTFYVRIPVDGGMFRYDRRDPGSTHLNGGEIPFLTPPAVGDLVGLWDAETREFGNYRVVERDWHYASYGSRSWPVGEPAPKEGPLMSIIVEHAVGPFRDEVPSEEEEAQQ